MTWTFDRASAFHATNRFEPVPRRHRNHDLMVDVDRGLHAAAFAAVPSDALRRRDGSRADGVIDITADDSDATARGGDADGFGPRSIPATASETDTPSGRGASLRAANTSGSGTSWTRSARTGASSRSATPCAGRKKKGLASRFSTPRGKPPPRAPASSPTSASVRSPTRSRWRSRASRASLGETWTHGRPQNSPFRLPLPATRTTRRRAKRPPETKRKDEHRRDVLASLELLRSARRVLTRAFGGGEAERRISEAHRAVIEGLLGVHTFNARSS